MRDAPLVSACTAGIPKPTHFNPSVPELIPLSEALPMMGIALCCVWAAYTTTELPVVATSTVMSPEVAADAAEPLAWGSGHSLLCSPRRWHCCSFSRGAEPPEAAVLASAPCMVVVSSNVLSACRVAVKETVTAVEPPEVAATAAEPLEVSVVSTHKLSACPVTAMEADCDLSVCLDADFELSVLPVSVNRSDHELSNLSSSKQESCYLPH